MSVVNGRKLPGVRSLKVAFDTRNIKSVVSTGQPTGADVGGARVKDILNSGRTYTQNFPLTIQGKTYYTLYGITYPEGNYSPSSRDGITPGLNNITAGKLYSCSRDLNYFAFDEDTNTWVADSYFTGERIDGHCYDTYDGLSGDGVSSEHLKFQQNYDNIKSTFPNATHIVIGSHAAENNDNDAATLSRLKEIGVTDAIVGASRPEYIAVGKVNRPETHTFVFENVAVEVVKLNLGLPLEDKTSGGMIFSGTAEQNDIVISPSFNPTTDPSNDYTLEAWIKRSATGRTDGVIGDLQYNWFGIYINTSNKIVFGHKHQTPSETRIETISNGTVAAGVWTHIVCTFTEGNGMRIYINGVLDKTDLSDTIAFNISGTNRGVYYIGSYYTNVPSDGNEFLGEISVVNCYNKALSGSEIKETYNSSKKRFGV